MKIFITSILFITILSGCVTGSSIITGNVRTAIDPKIVKIYLNPPAKYETIAIIEVSSDVAFSSQAAQNRTINKLKKEAAKLGANGVLFKSTENKISNGAFVNGISSDKKVTQGEAIYIIQE